MLHGFKNVSCHLWFVVAILYVIVTVPAVVIDIIIIITTIIVRHRRREHSSYFSSTDGNGNNALVAFTHSLSWSSLYLGTSKNALNLCLRLICIGGELSLISETLDGGLQRRLDFVPRDFQHIHGEVDGDVLIVVAFLTHPEFCFSSAHKWSVKLPLRCFRIPRRRLAALPLLPI